MQEPISIIILGPESTGKTTLFNKLAQDLSIPSSRLIPEVARSLMERNRWTGVDYDMLERQQDILEETLRIEEEMEERIEREVGQEEMRKSVEVQSMSYADQGGTRNNTEDRMSYNSIRSMEDRCGICCLVYARLLEEERQSQPNSTVDKSKPPFWTTLFAQLQSRGSIDRYRNALVILLEPVEEFLEVDGLRRISPDWWYTFEVYVDMLNIAGIKYDRIGKNILNINERVKEVKTLIEKKKIGF